MGRFVIRRVGQGLIVLWAAASVAFLLAFLTGDPATLMIGDGWSEEQIRRFRDFMGFDRPLHVQYLEFLGRVARGDTGTSIRQQSPVTGLLLERLPATLELAGAAMLIIVSVAIPVGVLSATRPNSAWDVGALTGTLLVQSMPIFWLGLVLILFFGVTLQWFPIGGRGGLSHLVLPAVALASYSTARNARLVRASVLDVLSQDYVRTARAKGVAERTVIWRHALRNALIPVVTMLGLEAGNLLAGAVVTETVFSWPGIGRLMIEAIRGRDYPLIQGAVTFVAFLFVTVNLVVDLSYGALDPRIRHG